MVMITYSGIHVQKIGGADGTPTPTDIAVHAGRLCRFGGSVWYPLLPHLVFVGLMAYRRSSSIPNLLWGFLHDAHETITGDVPRPFKCDCMRREQYAIDLRLYNDFMKLSEILVDHDLIKQCDIDACDIEAMELGVPNYKAITTACGSNGDMAYHHELHADKDDQKLFRRIRQSPFMESTLYGEASNGVRRFAHALTLAKVEDYDNFFNVVKGWDLL
jgi:hypothetical protein